MSSSSPIERNENKSRGLFEKPRFVKQAIKGEAPKIEQTSSTQHTSVASNFSNFGAPKSANLNQAFSASRALILAIVIFFMMCMVPGVIMSMFTAINDSQNSTSTDSQFPPDDYFDDYVDTYIADCGDLVCTAGEDQSCTEDCTNVIMQAEHYGFFGLSYAFDTSNDDFTQIPQGAAQYFSPSQDMIVTDIDVFINFCSVGGVKVDLRKPDTENDPESGELLGSNSINCNEINAYDFASFTMNDGAGASINAGEVYSFIVYPMDESSYAAVGNSMYQDKYPGGQALYFRPYEDASGNFDYSNFAWRSSGDDLAFRIVFN